MGTISQDKTISFVYKITFGDETHLHPGHHYFLTALNESLWTSRETNFQLIRFERLIGLKITLVNSHIPRARLDVSVSVPETETVVGYSILYPLLPLPPPQRWLASKPSIFLFGVL